MPQLPPLFFEKLHLADPTEKADGLAWASPLVGWVWAKEQGRGQLHAPCARSPFVAGLGHVFGEDAGSGVIPVAIPQVLGLADLDPSFDHDPRAVFEAL